MIDNRPFTRKLTLEQFESRLLLAVVTYQNEASFLADLPNATTFDFEAASGFPDASGGGLVPIGSFGGVGLDAAVALAGTIPNASGSQVMTASNAFNDTAVIDFKGLAPMPTGFGFYGLDLQVGETIRVAVDFVSGPDRIFDITLGGSAPGTPKFFGVINSADAIEDVAVFGQTFGAIGSPLQPWALDDFSFDANAASEPAPPPPSGGSRPGDDPITPPEQPSNPPAPTPPPDDPGGGAPPEPPSTEPPPEPPSTEPPADPPSGEMPSQPPAEDPPSHETRQNLQDLLDQARAAVDESMAIVKNHVETLRDDLADQIHTHACLRPSPIVQEAVQDVFHRWLR